MSFEINIFVFCFKNEPSALLIGAPFVVPIAKTKTTIFFSFANLISFLKSFLSPPSLKISRYFLDSFLILLSTTLSIERKFVPFSVIESVLSSLSKNATALLSKLRGETR